MTKKISGYGQYKDDLFNKLNLELKSGSKILDVGCGDGSDCVIFSKEFGLDVYGIDIFKHENIDRIEGLKFQKAGIFEIPFNSKEFDYVFLHDVLHHIDEQNQDYHNHIKGLEELRRVCKKGGQIIIVEGNRYNPLFYPHMVKMLGHNHWKQSYFKKILSNIFGKSIGFCFFECHFYPNKWINFWKIYEKLMERFSPKKFLAYNVAICELNGDL